MRFPSGESLFLFYGKISSVGVERAFFFPETAAKTTQESALSDHDSVQTVIQRYLNRKRSIFTNKSVCYCENLSLQIMLTNNGRDVARSEEESGLVGACRGGSGRIKAEFPFIAQQNRVVWPADSVSRIPT